MEPMQVYEVASFYTMFNRTKLGKYHLQVCGTTPCMLRGVSHSSPALQLIQAREIIDAIKEHCHMGMDEISEDGLFTVSEVECLGACVNAPMLQINNEWFYEVTTLQVNAYLQDLTPENTIALLDKFKAGEEPTVGP